MLQGSVVQIQYKEGLYWRVGTPLILGSVAVFSWPWFSPRKCCNIQIAVQSIFVQCTVGSLSMLERYAVYSG